mgnify:CR=1 FL=1
MMEAMVQMTGDSGLSKVWKDPVDDPEEIVSLPPSELVAGLPGHRLKDMQVAGDEFVDIYRVLAKTDDNVVGLFLKEYETFYEWDHYPEGDVYDHETHSQYYYHAHRGANGEHGHFHIFQRQKGMPAGLMPLPLEQGEPWPKGTDQIAHLIAVSMDKFGVPTHLFTTNRWVTGENLYRAEDVIAMLDGFSMDLVWPSWPTNRWMNALMVLFRPQIEALIHRRDAVLAKWMAEHPGDDILENRELEITGMVAIDADEQIAAVQAALSAQS